jgi:hypothetical protein
VGDNELLAAMTELCRREFRIEHTTIQVEHESRRPAESGACADRQPRAG